MKNMFLYNLLFSVYYFVSTSYASHAVNESTSIKNFTAWSVLPLENEGLKLISDTCLLKLTRNMIARGDICDFSEIKYENIDSSGNLPASFLFILDDLDIDCLKFLSNLLNFTKKRKNLHGSGSLAVLTSETASFKDKKKALENIEKTFRYGESPALDIFKNNREILIAIKALKVPLNSLLSKEETLYKIRNYRNQLEKNEKILANSEKVSSFVRKDEISANLAIEFEKNLGTNPQQIIFPPTFKWMKNIILNKDPVNIKLECLIKRLKITEENLKKKILIEECKTTDKEKSFKTKASDLADLITDSFFSSKTQEKINNLVEEKFVGFVLGYLRQFFASSVDNMTIEKGKKDANGKEYNKIVFKKIFSGEEYKKFLLKSLPQNFREARVAKISALKPPATSVTITLIIKGKVDNCRSNNSDCVNEVEITDFSISLTRKL